MSSIHGVNVGDCWRWKSVFCDQLPGYFVITDLNGPSVVRGWYLGGRDLPRLVEMAGDILEKYGQRMTSPTEITSPTVPR